MGEDTPPNLFDLSAKGSPKKKGKPAAVKPPPPSQKAQAPAVTIADDELQKLFARGWELHAALSKQLDLLFAKSGKDASTWKKYLNTSSNFTPEQWKILQEKKDNIEMELMRLSKEEVKARKAKTIAKKASKTRKGKTLGARRKWIDMH